MKNNTTAAMVLAARRKYRKNPTLKTAGKFTRLYELYQDRFPNRRINFLDGGRVGILLG